VSSPGTCRSTEADQVSTRQGHAWQCIELRLRAILWPHEPHARARAGAGGRAARDARRRTSRPSRLQGSEKIFATLSEDENSGRRCDWASSRRAAGDPSADGVPPGVEREPITWLSVLLSEADETEFADLLEEAWRLRRAAGVVGRTRKAESGSSVEHTPARPVDDVCRPRTRARGATSALQDAAADAGRRGRHRQDTPGDSASGRARAWRVVRRSSPRCTRQRWWHRRLPPSSTFGRDPISRCTHAVRQPGTGPTWCFCSTTAST
jgi:hypothetical protein